MPEPAVHVEDLGKRYQLGLTHADSLSDIASGLTRKLRGLFSDTADGKANDPQRGEFWALREVSFDVEPGEVFGIIGRNGAGKSTLLKLISRVTSPTTGRIDICGRVASLLEVGTGFHPDLTGRENIYMNATLLGMTRREVNERLDEIVQFAGVGDFLETQVKRYSSGMRVRLGFAVAAHLQPEILIIDEVLTVGDAEFQAKCLGKMKSVASHGRTVLFVSHNMSAVRNLCTRACFLDGGRLVEIGSTDDVVDHYLNAMGKQFGSTKSYRPEDTFDLDGVPVLRPISFSARAVDSKESLAFTTEQSIELNFEFTPLRNIAHVRVGVLVRNIDNITLFGSNLTLKPVPTGNGGGAIRVACVIPGALLNRGTYIVDLGVDQPPQHNHCDMDYECIQFEVTDVEGHGAAAEFLPGVVRPKLIWSQSVGSPPT